MTKAEVVDEMATKEGTLDESVPPRSAEPWAPPASGFTPPPPPSVSRPPRQPRIRKWGLPFAILGALLLVFIAVATWLPTDRYAIAPGSAQPVAPRVQLSTKTFPSKGKLLFVTVSIPKLSVLGRIVGEIDPDVNVRTAREIFGDQTREQNQVAQLKVMGYSKETAAYVALKRLGYHVGLTGGGPVIQSLCMQFKNENDPKSACVRTSPAAAALHAGDAITAVDGHPVVLPEDIAPLLADKKPGDKVTLTIVPKGSSKGKDVEVTLTESSDGRTIIGFIPINGGVHADVGYKLPVTVKVSTGEISGPSAGLAFTLTLLDELTPGDLTGGKKVAATGTINIDGSVGDIGGLHQKTIAVRQAGASYFLVPKDQEKEAIDAAKGSSLKVIGVSSVDEALQALKSIGGDVSAIPPAPSA